MGISPEIKDRVEKRFRALQEGAMKAIMSLHMVSAMATPEARLSTKDDLRNMIVKLESLTSEVEKEIGYGGERKDDETALRALELMDEVEKVVVDDCNRITAKLLGVDVQPKEKVYPKGEQAALSDKDLEELK